jgi:hypothetical protein
MGLVRFRANAANTDTPQAISTNSYVESSDYVM